MAQFTLKLRVLGGEYWKLIVNNLFTRDIVTVVLCRLSLGLPLIVALVYMCGTVVMPKR